MSDQPTAEAIAEAVARVQQRILRAMRRRCADADCVACQAIDADADALRLLLTLAADYMSVEDREQALDQAQTAAHYGRNGPEHARLMAEARRLLKLTRPSRDTDDPDTNPYYCGPRRRGMR